jgi:hypothetical protein
MDSNRDTSAMKIQRKSSLREKENNRIRERRRRAITARIYSMDFELKGTTICRSIVTTTRSSKLYVKKLVGSLKKTEPSIAR